MSAVAEPQDPQDAWATLATAVEGAADLLDGREGPAPPLPHLTDNVRLTLANHLRETLERTEPAITRPMVSGRHGPRAV